MRRLRTWRTAAGVLAVVLAWPRIGVAGDDAGAAGVEVPRTIIALYDPREGDVVATEIHRHAEMPLNHLGLVVDYHDINQPLPDLAQRPDVRGVLVWEKAPRMLHPANYLRWLREALDSGRYFVSLGTVAGLEDQFGRPTDRKLVNSVFAATGVRFDDEHDLLGAAAEIEHQSPSLVGYEHDLREPLPFFVPTRRTTGGRTWLSVRSPHVAEALDLVVIGAQGAYAARDFALYRGSEFSHTRWIINPFEFFRLAFATDDLPKADTTTIVGRRIYYSHIDGDGWRNLSLVDEYAGASVMSAKVVLEEAIRPFPDLPVTVAPISADLDLAWYGTRESRQIARELLELPQVELGSHTHSHPFSWGFFENYQVEDERRFVPRYRKLNGGRYRGWGTVTDALEVPEKDVEAAYDATFVPRAYGISPFSLALEIAGSIELLEGVTGGRHRVRVLQWSGDTLPYASALAATERAGIANINGGDSRFDTEFPSYAFVAPIGRRLGPHTQVYASNSNENTYTDLWRGRYYGFGFLPETLERTERPTRVRAANIYYHMYSGEREAALKALINNLRWARAHRLAPIATSHYARIGEGFYTTRFIRLGEQSWRIEGRGALATLRFDGARKKTVDWSRSRGVIGQHHFQNSLYVALDEAVSDPLVALQDSPAGPTQRLHLDESRWPVRDCEFDAGSGRCSASGYGPGEMSWRGRISTRYQVEILAPDEAAQSFVIESDNEGQLSFSLGPARASAVQFRISTVGSGAGS